MPLRPPAGFISANYDPLRNPDAPTGVTAAAGDAQATVSFTAPANVGGSAISAYYAVSNPGQITASGASSPVTVTGLTNDTAYTFQVWALNSFGPGAFSAASNSVSPIAARGLFGGGRNNTPYESIINYIQISTTGNATFFGNLTVARVGLASCSSSTRGVWAGGDNGGPFSRLSTIDYVTIQTLGNATSFGNLSSSVTDVAGLSNATRGIFGGGVNPGPTAAMTYITIATTGNSVSFGTLNISSSYYLGAFASSTRGIFGGGLPNNIIDYVTIATTGNATDFGDLTVARGKTSGCSNSTRGIFSGGEDTGGAFSNVIDYITIATLGNATDFGDLLQQIKTTASCSSGTRGVIGGGLNASTYTAQIQYVTLSSTGNATNFGNLTYVASEFAGCSNAHGGL